MRLKIGEVILQFIIAIFMVYILSLVLKALDFSVLFSFFIILFLLWASIMWLLKEMGIIR